MNDFISKLKGNSKGRNNYSIYKKNVLLALKRWSQVQCIFTNTFYEGRGKKKRTVDQFSFLEYSYSEEGDDATGMFLIDFTVRFSNFFWEVNAKKKASILLNLNHTLQIKSALGQRLYAVLAKNRISMDKAGYFPIGLTKLAVKLGMQNMANIHRPSLVKAKIDKAMEEISPLLKVTHNYTSDGIVVFGLDLD